MKLSAYMKTEMEYVSDKYLLEAADTGKNFRLAPMYILPSNESSPIDKLKKIASVAACVVLAVAVIVAFILMRNSISPGGDDPADSETETGTETETELNDEEKEAIKLKLISIYEPNPEGALALYDDKVYRNTSFYNYNRIKVNDNDLGLCDLYLRSMTDTTEQKLVCTDDDCDHDSIYCPAKIPAVSSDLYLSIYQEGRETPIIYTIGMMREKLTDSGVSVTIPDLDTTSVNSESNVIFEYDLETNTRRTVAVRIPFYGLYDNSFYYNGKIYVTEERDHTTYDEETGEKIHGYREEAFFVDVTTGEWQRFDSEEGVSICGVYDGKLYLLNTEGDIIKCDPDFSEPEIVTNVGESSKYDMGSGKQAYYAQNTLIEDGVLYYVRNEKREIFTVTDESGMSTDLPITSGELYALNLAEANALPKLIEDEVIPEKLEAYNGCLYYTAVDCELYGFYLTEINNVPIMTKNGGTLYKYDPETAEVTVLFEDCGGDIEGIDMITIDGVIFSGIYYKGLDEGYKYQGAGCRSYMEYNYVKNELTIIGDIK